MSARAVAALLLVALVPLPGCAAVFDGTRQKIHVTSDPPADLIRQGGLVGTTPQDVSIVRQEPATFTVHKDGYEEAQVHATQHPAVGWFIWDIGSCVIPVALCIPLLADAVTGSWMGFDDEFAVRLRPQAAAPAAQEPSAIGAGH